MGMPLKILWKLLPEFLGKFQHEHSSQTCRWIPLKIMKEYYLGLRENSSQNFGSILEFLGSEGIPFKIKRKSFSAFWRNPFHYSREMCLRIVRESPFLDSMKMPWIFSQKFRGSFCGKPSQCSCRIPFTNSRKKIFKLRKKSPFKVWGYPFLDSE